MCLVFLLDESIKPFIIQNLSDALFKWLRHVKKEKKKKKRKWRIVKTLSDSCCVVEAVEGDSGSSGLGCRCQRSIPFRLYPSSSLFPFIFVYLRLTHIEACRSTPCWRSNVKDENLINIVKFGNLFPIGLIANDDGDHVFFVVDNEALGF